MVTRSKKMNSKTKLDRIADERMCSDGYRNSLKSMCAILSDVRCQLDMLTAIAVSPFRQGNEPVDDVLKKIKAEYDAQFRQ